MTEIAKRGKGRPKKAISKTSMLSVRLTKSESDEIDQASTRVGLTKSEWIQKVLLTESREINGET